MYNRKDLNEISNIITNAGNILKKKFDSNLVHNKKKRYSFKSGNEIVIDEDELSQEYIINRIAKFDSNIKVYSEELDSLKFLKKDNSSMKLLIDPLDGTHNFFFGIANWAVSIALLDQNNYPIFGVIYLPMHNLLIRNDKINGKTKFFKNGNEFKTNCIEPTKSLEVIAYDNQFHKLNYKAMKIYKKLTAEVFTTRISGSAQYDAALIAMGKIHGRIFNNTTSYDISPCLPIIKGAGGCASDFNNRPVNAFSKSVVLSSGKKIHSSLLGLIK